MLSKKNLILILNRKIELLQSNKDFISNIGKKDIVDKHCSFLKKLIDQVPNSSFDQLREIARKAVDDDFYDSIDFYN